MTGHDLTDAAGAGIRSLPGQLWDVWAGILDDVAQDPALAISPAAAARVAIGHRLEAGVVTDRQARELLDHLAERVRLGYPL